MRASAAAALLPLLLALSCASGQPRDGASQPGRAQPSAAEARPEDGACAEEYLLTGRGILRAFSLKAREPRGSFFIAHGYGASSKAFLPLARALAEAGYACALVDLPGHGLSYGPSGEVGDFREYGEALAAAASAARGDPGFPRPWLGFGHSLGGIAAYEAVASAGADFDGLVLAMPLARSSFWRPLRAASFMLRPFARILPGASLGGVPISWIDGLADWNRRRDRPVLSFLPALILVGAKDEVVQEKSLRRSYAALLPRAVFIELPETGHHALESKSPPPEILALILDFAAGLEEP